MQSEDQYVDRTPDLVAKVRALREAADREMNRFSRVSDYDVRRVVGHGQKPTPVSVETVAPVRAGERAKKRVMPHATAQASIEFAPASVERANTGENE
jgi:hypothetical protein